MWAKVKADQVIEVFSGAKAITDSNGVQHPSSIFSNWSKDELKNIGIYAVSMATPSDSRFYKGGTPSYSFSNGKVITQDNSGRIAIGAAGGNQVLNIVSHDNVDGGLELAGVLVTSSANFESFDLKYVCMIRGFWSISNNAL